MSYGVTLLKFRDDGIGTIPWDALVGILVRHGCEIPAPQEGSNRIGLPPDHEADDGRAAEIAGFTVKDGAVTAFGLHRPQATMQCWALLFSLIDELGLAMFPDFGGVIFAREDVFHDIPRDILRQFAERIAVHRPEDCAL